MAKSPRNESYTLIPEPATLTLPSPLSFPAPHRLGKSSHAHPVTQFPLHPPAALGGGIVTTTATITADELSSVQDAGLLDEPDLGPPLTKRVKPYKRARQQGENALVVEETKPIVTLYRGATLVHFSLFLPSRLPAAIFQDKLALLNYTTNTLATYITMWELKSSMSLVDIRLPQAYTKCFLNDVNFYEKFFQTLVSHLNLAKVVSIEELFLPLVDINAFTDLGSILQPLNATSATRIKRLGLSVSFTIQSASLNTLNYANIAKALQATNANEVTIISSDVVLLPQFYTALKEAFIRKQSQSLKLLFSVQEASYSGPPYLSRLDSSSEGVGEVADPHSLVESVNYGKPSLEIPGTLGLDEQRHTNRRRKQKESLKHAFTTDCSYADPAQLTTDSTFVSQLWNLDRLHDRGTDGSGTTIAILDSGISYTHPAFKNKILAVRNFVPSEIDDIDCVIDSDGHGSLCAGIAAGRSFNCPLNPDDATSPCIKIPAGVAPGAKLIICKVVDTKSGDVNVSAFLAALKWLKELHLSGTEIDIISISLASCYYSRERAEVICDLASLGIILVCCASNVGRMRLHPIAFPARLGHVLCVGTHDTNGKPASFSPVGRELDFLAPGEEVWGPGPGTLGPFAMDCGSGTSCSTPAVAGLVSLVLHAVRQLCEADEDDSTILAGKSLTHWVHNGWVMRELLKEMSSSPGHHSEEVGHGTLDPYRLLDRSLEEVVRIVNEIIEEE